VIAGIIAEGTIRRLPGADIPEYNLEVGQPATLPCLVHGQFGVDPPNLLERRGIVRFTWDALIVTKRKLLNDLEITNGKFGMYAQARYVVDKETGKLKLHIITYKKF